MRNCEMVGGGKKQKFRPKCSWPKYLLLLTVAGKRWWNVFSRSFFCRKSSSTTLQDCYLSNQTMRTSFRKYIVAPISFVFSSPSFTCTCTFYPGNCLYNTIRRHILDNGECTRLYGDIKMRGNGVIKTYRYIKEEYQHSSQIVA